jgi:mannose-6-phosphate isomerase-like protein (cupin superfamily)
MDRISLPHLVDDTAPDGSEVRLLVRGESGSMAHFRLAPGDVSSPKRHRQVEELWYFTGGRGEMCIGDEVTIVCAGVSIRIPPETRFQFRCLGDQSLDAVAVTMPPWPGDDEALDAESYWPEES